MRKKQTTPKSLPRDRHDFTVSLPKSPPRHRHKFSASSWQGDVVGFRCTCGEERTRPINVQEKAKHKAEWNLKSKPGVHRVYHSFVKTFRKDNAWKWVGYDLMKRVEKWAKKYPRDVRITGVDDDHFASSDLVLIECQTDNSYMGTSVVYIPQCTGEKPIQFFLYPTQRSGLISALKEIAKEEAPRRKREQAEDRKRAKWWNSRAKIGFDKKGK